jgi:hypothetical protein
MLKRVPMVLGGSSLAGGFPTPWLSMAAARARARSSLRGRASRRCVQEVGQSLWSHPFMASPLSRCDANWSAQNVSGQRQLSAAEFLVVLVCLTSLSAQRASATLHTTCRESMHLIGL